MRMEHKFAYVMWKSATPWTRCSLAACIRWLRPMIGWLDGILHVKGAGYGSSRVCLTGGEVRHVEEEEPQALWCAGGLG